MSSIVPSSSGKTADFHQTNSHALSSGSLNGRTVDSETSQVLPKEFIVPKMSDLHPEIRMDDLPQSLARNLNGINAIEIQLCHIFHMTTESTLLELQQMFGTANVEEIIVRFSFITTIINTLNKAMRTSKSYSDESLDVTIREMTLLLPALVKNLLEQWEEKEKALDRMKMGTNTRKAALEKTQEVKELFHYLSQMINENESRIEVFATPTIHLLQSNESKDKSIDHWLERVLRIHTTMLRSFSSSSVFWNNTTNGPHDKFRDHFIMMNKLISRRRENLKISNQCPNASLFQLHETLCNQWGKVGGMYTRAQLLLNSQQGVKRGKPLGFFPDLFQKLSSELDPEHIARAFSLTMSTAPFYINLHRQYLPITQTMMCCALAEGVRSKRTSLDIKTLDTIIQEAKEFSDYFTSIEDNIKKQAFFLSGTSPVTFSDLCIHIRNCIALIEDLRDSSKDCSESILYSLFDLKGSLTKSVRNGLEIYLNVLQHKLENLETHSTSQIDRSQIEEIITSIDTIIKLTSLVNDKSSVIEKLTKRLLLDFAKKMSEIQV